MFIIRNIRKFKKSLHPACREGHAGRSGSPGICGDRAHASKEHGYGRDAHDDHRHGGRVATRFEDVIKDLA